MSSITVRIPVLVGIVVFALLLVAADAFLIRRNRALQLQVHELIMRDFAKAGSELPTLAGTTLDGTPREIDLAHSAPLVILLFEPDCDVCEQNWPAWETLINDPKIHRLILLTSPSRKVPKSYLLEHHAAQSAVIVGISPDTVRSFNLGSTPQTILVQHGRIVQTWPGTLSDKDVLAIKNRLVAILSRAS